MSTTSPSRSVADLPLTSALDVLEAMIQEEAAALNRAATLVGRDYDRLRMGTGGGIRLEALKDARSRIVEDALRHV